MSSSRDSGHWTASVDINGQWWYCNNQYVTSNLTPKTALISMVILKKSGLSCAAWTENGLLELS